MASLLVRNAAFSTSRALTGRTAGFAKSAAFVSKPWTASPRRCFSQTLQRLERRYTESHEWIEVSPDGKTSKIGISTHAAEALGDVVYVEVAEKGDEVSQDESFGSVESVKSASDIVSPVSGTVIAVNEAIVEKPGDLAKDPEGEGWLVEVENTDVSGVDSLMDAKAYGEFSAEQ